MADILLRILLGGAVLTLCFIIVALLIECPLAFAFLFLLSIPCYVIGLFIDRWLF